MQWKTFIFIIFIIFIFTRLRMYQASVNTTCAYNNIVRIQAWMNENKGIYIFSMSITFTCAVLVWCLTVASFAIAQLITIEWKTNDRNKSLWVFQKQFDLLIKNQKKLTTGNRSHKHQKQKNPQNYDKGGCKILNPKHIASVTVLGEAKSEPQAYYIVIVSGWFVFVFLPLLSHTQTKTYTNRYIHTQTHTRMHRERERERERETHTHTHTHTHTN